MTIVNPLARLDAAGRTEVIHSLAKATALERLWQVALGTTPEQTANNSFAPLLAPVLLSTQEADEPNPPAAAGSATGEFSVTGPNAIHAPAIAGAAARTGIPAAAIAAIVDAEAGRTPDGMWNPLSRNPRSTAAGLGQFLAGTWEGIAERPGTWLNGEAERRGWLTAGRLRPDARADLLALRYDPSASIESVADYASLVLNGLKAAGIPPGRDVHDTARQAYLGHHLGLGDAVRFLKSGLPEGRARQLLAAQVGLEASNARIASEGNATAAHRSWLENYIQRRIKVPSFV